ncbi:hypothetical protein Bind_0212 [Beijerinckia indica subsp. indica ATCC 9039]|uniref:Uncharacterized protein n=1 Tax=Beijerinckia indica subsp. indica (strain ATCC 9039 / DSM 1715 / NCIMB 8712) TaxID=395963 RepID=B2ICH9_BEII9|nr:hypothetical protein Bind_0212 [Beijerinckia indica subsp. indica ATCC 9039]
MGELKSSRKKTKCLLPVHTLAAGRFRDALLVKQDKSGLTSTPILYARSV